MVKSSMGLVVVLSLALSPFALAQEALKAERPAVKVGDAWRYDRVNADGSRLEVRREIKAVSSDSVTVVVTDAAGTTEQQWSLDLNYMSGEGKRVWRPDSQYMSFPLTVGKQWKVNAKGVNAAGRDIAGEGACKVVSLEKVAVRVGTFDAFKVDCDVEFYIFGPGVRVRDRYVYWYAPALRGDVRAERVTRSPIDVVFDWKQELVSTTVLQ
jgi:hypothetical protein